MNVTAFNLTSGQKAELTTVLTYGRVSTARQVRTDGDVGSLEKQDEAMRTLVESYAKSKGWKIAGQLVDKAKSGDNPHRPGLRRLREAARRREFNVLVVFAQDRLARDWETVKKTIRELESFGVQIYSSNGTRITHQTLEGLTTSMILAVISELGLETIRFGRIKDIATTAAMGKWPGGRQPMGYLAVKGKGRRRDLYPDKEGFAPHATEILMRLAMNEPASIIIADFRRRDIRTPSMRVKRNGLEVELGRQPVEWKHIESIAGNPIYMGCIAVKQFQKARASGGAGLPDPYDVLSDGTAIYRGEHEPLVSEETWRSAHRSFFTRQKTVRKPRTADFGANFLLQGLIRCRHCDRTMTTRRATGARNYTCMAAYLGGKNGHKCPVCSVPALAVETAVLRLFSNVATHSDILDQIFSDTRQNTSQAAERIADGRKASKELKDQCDRLIEELGKQSDAAVRGTISARLRELGTQIAEVERAIEDALCEDPNMNRTRGAFVVAAQKIFLAHDEHADACRPTIKALLHKMLAAIYVDARRATNGTRTFGIELRLKYGEAGVDNGVKVPVNLEFCLTARGRTLEIKKPFNERCDLGRSTTTGNPALLLLEKYLALSETMSRAEIARKQGKQRPHVTQVLALQNIPPPLRAKIMAAPSSAQERFSQNCLRKIAALGSDAEMEAAINRLLLLAQGSIAPKAA